MTEQAKQEWRQIEAYNRAQKDLALTILEVVTTNDETKEWLRLTISRFDGYIKQAEEGQK